jgi:hypothetical protein
MGILKNLKSFDPVISTRGSSNREELNAMGKIARIYIFIELCVVIFAVIIYVIWDKRYRKNHGSNIQENRGDIFGR